MVPPRPGYPLRAAEQWEQEAQWGWQWPQEETEEGPGPHWGDFDWANYGWYDRSYGWWQQ